MHDDLKPLFDQLIKDYLNLRLIWDEFNRLFSDDQKNIEAMNNVAPGFFRMVQDMMIESIIMGLSRMTDDAKIGKHYNLSLFQLLCVPHSELEGAFEEITTLVATARASVETARHWRDKRTAHRDLVHHHATFTIGYNELRDGIKAIHTVLNQVSIIAWNETIAEYIIPRHGGAERLLAALNQISTSRASNDIEA